jgi:hypothetical protein
MNSNIIDENEIKNCTNILIQNTYEYAWIKFVKCCGYSIMFPFVLDDSIQSLYRHIDLLWKNCSINLIWLFNSQNEKIVITRGDNRTIRQFIHENLIYRPNFGIIYSIYFDVDTHHKYVYGHNHKNIN